MNFSGLMLGTVQFGLNYGIANATGKPSYETARDIIQTAFANGINCLDTAAAYGDSEIVLGRALAELQLKNKISVISKVPGISRQNLSENEAERFITESVGNSLIRLGVERLAGCLFHDENDIKYIGILQNLERQGLIGGAGISLDSDRRCQDVVAAGIKYVQLPYNILDKRFDAFLSAARRHGIKIFSRSVYLQGLLLMPEKNINEALREVIPVRHRLERLAAEAGMDMSELCMRFALSNPAITSVLTGVDNVVQLRHNLNLLARGPLPEELHRAVRNAVPHLAEKTIRPTCWPKENNSKNSSSPRPLPTSCPCP